MNLIAPLWIDLVKLCDPVNLNGKGNARKHTVSTCTLKTYTINRKRLLPPVKLLPLSTVHPSNDYNLCSRALSPLRRFCAIYLILSIGLTLSKTRPWVCPNKNTTTLTFNVSLKPHLTELNYVSSLAAGSWSTDISFLPLLTSPIDLPIHKC